MSRLYRLLVIPIILAAMLAGGSLNASAAPAFLGTTPTPTPINCIPVEKAVSQGLIQLTLTGSGEVFYHDPLHYKIENLTTKPLRICFPAGQIANPGDSSYQSLIIAKTIIIDLAAGETKEGNLPAFCINESKHAPSQENDYKLGKMASGDLLKVAQAIEASSAQGHLGAQMAVWTITDQYSLNDLNATPTPGQPSLTDTIRPLLCLAQDEVDLGQQILQDAKVKESLYQGENPLTSYCQSQGIPSVSQMVQRAKLLGERALLILGAGALGCIIVVVLVILLAIRLFRKRK